MKKVVLLIVLILLTGGCKVEYKLTIDDDLSVIENVNMTGTEAFFDIYYKSSKLNIVEMLLNINKEPLDNNRYNYKIIEESTPYVLVDKEYKDIASFTDNTIFYQQYFDSLDYKENNGIITISTSDFRPNDPEDPDRFDISNLTIAIKSDYKVIDHNATSVNERNNTYYWNINRNTVDFQLLLSVDSNAKFNPYMNMYIIIITSILIVVITWLLIWYFNRRNKFDKKNKAK